MATVDDAEPRGWGLVTTYPPNLPTQITKKAPQHFSSFTEQVSIIDSIMDLELDQLLEDAISVSASDVQQAQVTLATRIPQTMASLPECYSCVLMCMKLW